MVGELMSSLWVRVQKRTGKVDETLQTDKNSLMFLDLMGDFSHHNICWRDNTAGHKYSRRFWSALRITSEI